MPVVLRDGRLRGRGGSASRIDRGRFGSGSSEGGLVGPDPACRPRPARQAVGDRQADDQAPRDPSVIQAQGPVAGVSPPRLPTPPTPTAPAPLTPSPLPGGGAVAAVSPAAPAPGGRAGGNDGGGSAFAAAAAGGPGLTNVAVYGSRRDSPDDRRGSTSTRVWSRWPSRASRRPSPRGRRRLRRTLGPLGPWRPRSAG